MVIVRNGLRSGSVHAARQLLVRGKADRRNLVRSVSDRRPPIVYRLSFDYISSIVRGIPLTTAVVQLSQIVYISAGPPFKLILGLFALLSGPLPFQEGSHDQKHRVIILPALVQRIPLPKR